MNITLVRQDESFGEVNVTLGEVTIGRGPLLGCTDKRVSRQHAQMKVSEEGCIILEAIHTSPVFYIKGENLPVELTKGDFVTVSDGDEFSLVPDSYRFRVVIPPQVDANHNGRVEAVDSTANAQTPDHTYERHLPSWMTDMAKRDESNVKAPCPQNREDEISDESVVNKKLKVASEDNDALGEDTSLAGDGPPGNDVPGSKTEPERAKLHEMSDDEEGGSVRDQVVKTEIEESSEDVANAAAQAGDTSTGATNQGTGNVQKTRCMYGAKCYRKNTEHRVEFSHPGDPDYDDTNLPECPYGTACYRKNKQHRLDFKHTTKPRQAKKPQQRQTDTPDDDDYDYDDPFLNDASSDDFQPTDTGSDVSDEMSSGEEEADTKRMMKEAKKFAKKKK